MPRRLAALALAAAAAALGAAAPAAHAQDTVPAFGTNSLKSEWLAGYNGAEGVDRQGLRDLDMHAPQKLGLYRARFRQDHVVGTTAGWTMLDHLTREAAKRGVTLVPVLMNMPGDKYAPPRTAEELKTFGDFAFAAVKRYGPGGSFWATCGCPARPIRAWQIWNEPNLAVYWGPVDPAAYATLVRHTRTRLRAADPGARIVLASLAYPLTFDAAKHEPDAFLRATIAGTGPNGFDAIGISMFRADPNEAAYTLVRNTAETLKSAAGADPSGAPRQQVWITEFGKTTVRDDPNTAADEAADSSYAQNRYYYGLIDRLQKNRAAWNIGPMLAYSIRDAASPTSAWHRYGMRYTNPDGTDAGPKGGWTALTTRSRVAPALPLPVAR